MFKQIKSLNQKIFTSITQFYVLKTMKSLKNINILQVRNKFTKRLFVIAEIFIVEKDIGECIKQYSLYLKMKHHPNILTCYDIFIETNKIYMVFQNFDGYLLDYISDIRKDDQKIKIYLIRIAWGIQYLHKNKLIHRNIKPESIAYSKQEDQVYITDFWNVKYQTAPSYLQIMDKLTWRPPEFTKYSEYERPGDVWGFGQIIYCMHNTSYQKDRIMNSELQMDKFKQKCLEKIKDPFAQQLLTGIMIQSPLERLTIKQIRQSKYLKVTK